MSLRKTYKKLRIDTTNPYLRSFKIRNYLFVLDMFEFITCIDREKNIYRIEVKIPINLDFYELMRWVVNTKKVYTEPMGVLLSHLDSRIELIRIHKKYKENQSVQCGRNNRQVTRQRL